MQPAIALARHAALVVAGIGAAIAWQAWHPAAPLPVAAKANAALVEPDAAAGALDAARVARAPDGLFYVRARVNGRPIRFLVDTGASVVVLTAADAAAAGVAPQPEHFAARMQTAAGNAAMAWTDLDAVQVAGREVRGVKAAVMRDGLAVSLLGQNMLTRLGSVRIEGDELELR